MTGSFDLGPGLIAASEGLRGVAWWDSGRGRVDSISVYFNGTVRWTSRALCWFGGGAEVTILSSV